MFFLLCSRARAPRILGGAEWRVSKGRRRIFLVFSGCAHTVPLAYEKSLSICLGNQTHNTARPLTLTQACARKTKKSSADGRRPTGAAPKTSPHHHHHRRHRRLLGLHLPPPAKNHSAHQRGLAKQQHGGRCAPHEGVPQRVPPPPPKRSAPSPQHSAAAAQLAVAEPNLLCNVGAAVGERPLQHVEVVVEPRRRARASVPGAAVGTCPLQHG